MLKKPMFGWIELRVDNVCAAVNEHPKERKSKQYEHMWLSHASFGLCSCCCSRLCMAAADASLVMLICIRV